jgi:predicted membrane channel-forming protein YqfA (hemolysin III family)
VKDQKGGPKSTGRQWILYFAFVILIVACFLGVLTLTLLLPMNMFFPSMMTFFGLSYVTLDSLRRRLRGGSLSLFAYVGAIVAIGGAITLGTLVTPQLTSQQHLLVTIFWGVVSFGIPFAWWFNNLEKGGSQVRSSPTA